MALLTRWRLDPSPGDLRERKRRCAITPDQQFYIAVITAFFGLITTIFGIINNVKSNRAISIAQETKEVVAPLPAAIDGAQDKMKDLIAEINQLRGEKAGAEREKADQALRESSAIAPVPVNPSSTPTAVNPLLTEGRAKELMENQTVIADKGEGWTPKTEPEVSPALPPSREEKK